ncbi:transglycosylase family protein [Euzebya tangerina]|uniref:transglycosylase family protein n=1 Tax=Euzebya tangerina TaxID=591198 RepID=UPI0023E7D60F|nr:transglycosylase family protein [Euzebya tangerina]
MFNQSKHYDNFRSRLVQGFLVLVVATAVQLLPASPARAAAPEQNPGCETYGCVYEHCPTHFTRGGGGECRLGIAYQRLPDGGADNRELIAVQWPGRYDPARRAMWDRVAFCESTWRWGYNGGSGFDGGLQFSPSTWRAFGGTEYAAYAHQALPEQQIDIAERVAFYGHGNNRPQGPGAWPSCGRYLSAP